MVSKHFVLTEDWMKQIENYLFRQAMRDDYVPCEAVELLYFPEDLVIETADGKQRRKFTWYEAMEIDSYIRNSYPGFRLPTVSEYVFIATEMTRDDLDGEDVIRELGLNLNGVGHPVGQGVAEHEGEWAAYWSSTDAGESRALDEHFAYALIASRDGLLLDRERVEVNRRLSFRLVYDLNQ